MRSEHLARRIYPVGVLGLAPKETDIVDSIPPSYFRKNIDNWRIGQAATMYYPIAVKAGLLSLSVPPYNPG